MQELYTVLYYIKQKQSHLLGITGCLGWAANQDSLPSATHISPSQLSHTPPALLLWWLLLPHLTTVFNQISFYSTTVWFHLVAWIWNCSRNALNFLSITKSTFSLQQSSLCSTSFILIWFLPTFDAKFNAKFSHAI